MKFVCVLHMIWRVWNRKILRKARKHEPQPHIDYNVVFTVTAGCRIQGWGDSWLRFGTARLSSASGSAAKRTGTAV